MKKTVLAAITAFTAAFLLLNPSEVTRSVSESVGICLDILVPSLFSFMFLSVFIVRSGVAASLGKPAEPLFRKIFKLPGSACAAVITAFIGGYPAGAKSASELCARGELTSEQARRLVEICFCSGPAFMIGTVGGMYLNNPVFGAIIFLSQVIGSLILLLFSSFGKKISASGIKELKKESISTAFVMSAYSAARAMLSICTMVIIFSVIKTAVCSFIDKSTLAGTLISNLTEITGDLGFATERGFAYLTFVTTFGGFCVHMQIFSFTEELGISKIRFVFFRIIHSVISTLITLCLIKLVPPCEYPAAAVFGHRVSRAAPTVAGSAALIMLCIVTVLVMPAKSVDFSPPLCYNGKKRGSEHFESRTVRKRHLPFVQVLRIGRTARNRDLLLQKAQNHQ